MTDPKCKVPAKKIASREISWFPECGIKRQKIVYNNEDRIVATTYRNLLVNANADCDVPFLYRREGGGLVYVGRIKDTSDFTVDFVTKDVLKSMLSEVGSLEVKDSDTGRWKEIRVHVGAWPRHILTTLMTLLANDPGIPVLRMLVKSPTLTRNGWLEETSYDPATGMLCHMNPAEWGGLDLLGEEEDLSRARELLMNGLLAETKLEKYHSRALLLGEMVGMVARPLFQNVPMVVHESGDFGTGKTTTDESLATVCLSRSEWALVTLTDFDGKSAEMDKRISDAMTKLYRHLILDDPREGIEFNHSDFATGLTSPEPVFIRTFGRLGGKDSNVRVDPNWSVSMCANNPNLNSRFESRIERAPYDAKKADNRTIEWGVKDYIGHVRDNRLEYNWAIRVVVNQAHEILSTPEGRAKWEAWMDGVVKDAGARGNFREWYIYTAVVADLMGIDFGLHFADREEYEAPTDEEAEKRSWLVQRMVELKATSESGAVIAGDLLSDGMDCPWLTPEALAAYLRKHASGKSGLDAGGHPWLIRQAKKKSPKGKVTWMALAAK